MTEFQRRQILAILLSLLTPAQALALAAEVFGGEKKGNNQAKSRDHHSPEKSEKSEALGKAGKNEGTAKNRGIGSESRLRETEKRATGDRNKDKEYLADQKGKKKGDSQGSNRDRRDRAVDGEAKGSRGPNADSGVGNVEKLAKVRDDTKKVLTLTSLAKLAEQIEGNLGAAKSLGRVAGVLRVGVHTMGTVKNYQSAAESGHPIGVAEALVQELRQSYVQAPIHAIERADAALGRGLDRASERLAPAGAGLERGILRWVGQEYGNWPRQ